MDQGKPPLRYRIRMVTRHPGYERIVDGLQLQEFLEAIWPTPMELDPTFSDRHREIVRRMKKTEESMRLARAGQKRHLDPTLSPDLTSKSSSPDYSPPRTNEVERKQPGPYQSEGENSEGCKGEGKRTEQVREEGGGADQVEQSRDEVDESRDRREK